ncbi:MAG: hypothetical protein BroJett003_26530 [Planctomycetota bacterium]|nr:MAG: hypothetical protein BroJett003_26530 [Planctomycetota bacterium]
MADSTIIALADAIVAKLQDGTFSLPLEVQRGYRPVVELPALQAVKVTVIPKSLAISAATRADGFYDCAIDIGVQRKVDVDDPAAMDELMKLVEEIGDHLRYHKLDGFAVAAWLALENEPVFAPEHLEQYRQFTSVLTVTYRVRR